MKGPSLVPTSQNISWYANCMNFTKCINKIRQLDEVESQHHQQKEIQLNSEDGTEGKIFAKFYSR